MKQVKQSIAIILFLLAACLADSFGQFETLKTYKQEWRKKNAETGKYEVIKSDNSPYEIEFIKDKKTMLFIGNTTNRFIIDKIILDKVINGFDTQTYTGYWDLIGNNCSLIINTSGTLMLLGIYYEQNGKQYSLTYFIKF
jgi:hypothetical protein